MFANTNTPKHKFQSTLSVRRATDYTLVIDVQNLISIHALREESDLNLVFGVHFAYISIHALREESDFKSFSLRTSFVYFNPRSP